MISLSSSWPTQVKSRSARSKPISSQVCRIAERSNVSRREEYPGTHGPRTCVTAAFVALLGPASRKGDMGARRAIDPIVCNDRGVFSGVLSFKKEDLRNGTRRVNPIELEELLERWLGLAWQNLGEAPWRGDANDQSNCSTTWLCRRRSDHARGGRTNFGEGVGQERDGRNWVCGGRVRILVDAGVDADGLTVGHDGGRRQGGWVEGTAGWMRLSPSLGATTINLTLSMSAVIVVPQYSHDHSSMSRSTK